MEQKSNGALVGAIIVILILVVGGIYLWQMSSTEEATEMAPVVNESSNTEDLATIEADLNSVELDSLDNEI